MPFLFSASAPDSEHPNAFIPWKASKEDSFSTRFHKYGYVFGTGSCTTGATGLSFKTRNEERAVKTIQKRGSKAGGAPRLSFPCKPSVVIPGSPSARLTRGLKLNKGQRLLRFCF